MSRRDVTRHIWIEQTDGNSKNSSRAGGRWLREPSLFEIGRNAGELREKLCGWEAGSLTHLTKEHVRGREGNVSEAVESCGKLLKLVEVRTLRSPGSTRNHHDQQVSTPRTPSQVP